MTIVHFHLVVLHFPIALLIVGAALEVAALLGGREGLHTAARISIVLGAVGAAATAWSGQLAEEVVEEALSVPEAVLERHEELGMWATYLAVVLLVAELVTLRVKAPVLRWGVAAVSVLVAVLVGLAGFSGGKIRHGSEFEGGSGKAAAELFVPLPERGMESED